MKPYRILALETSCDETAAAVVEDGRRILSSAVFTQMDIHALYGGVVPEIASRAHVDACDRMLDQALKDAHLTIDDIDALAVTSGPGLVGALLIGVNCMKGFSYATGKKLIAVNHIEGHVSANFLSTPDLAPPFVCLVVSGGHSHLVTVNDYGSYTLLGQTADDAAGEAFDKAARVLGLPYPGGPHLSALAEGGNPYVLKLPRPKAEGKYDFSFSGLKTAFINAVHNLEQKGQPLPKADLAASYQQAVVDCLCEKTMLAVEDSGLKTLCLAGGVSANKLLREQMAALAKRRGIRLCMPAIALCTDNAAMIASAAYYRREQEAELSLNAEPNLRLVQTLGEEKRMAHALRRLAEDDLVPAMELVWRVFSEFEAPEYSAEGIAEFRRFIQADTLAEKMRSGSMILWGWAEDGAIKGVLALTVTGHINLLLVDRAYQRRGIARALYRQAEAGFRACGVTKVTVNSSPYAVAVYRRLGFAPVSAEQTVNGIRFTPMVRRLDSGFAD